MPKRILIVDDETQMLSLLEDMLSDEYQIIKASNGAEALELAKQATIDLLVTDLVMPKMNGIDLIVAIRQSQPELKIIAISGGGGINGRFDYLPVAKLIGAGKILRKPFSPRELMQSIHDILA